VNGGFIRVTLVWKFHHGSKKVAKSFSEPVSIESLTNKATGDFANGRM
jgi:hypothetical protein